MHCKEGYLTEQPFPVVFYRKWLLAEQASLEGYLQLSRYCGGHYVAKAVSKDCAEVNARANQTR
jgi:hypothetical protein